MADMPKHHLEMTDYPGLMVYTSQGKPIPAGAAVEQTNIISLVPGQLQVRRGYKIVRFEEE